MCNDIQNLWNSELQNMEIQKSKMDNSTIAINYFSVKAITNIRFGNWCWPLVSHRVYAPIYSAFYWPIIYNHDVIHKNMEEHNYGIVADTNIEPQPQVTCRKFCEVWTHFWQKRVDRQLVSYCGTLYSYQEWSNYRSMSQNTRYTWNKMCQYHRTLHLQNWQIS